MKPNIRRLAIVSEALDLLGGTATSIQIAHKADMERLKTQQTLSELLRKGYVAKGARLASGNTFTWVLVKPFVIQEEKIIDWSMYYSIFHNMVTASHAQV